MSNYGTTTVCPECDTSVIFRRSGRKRPDRKGDGDWRCGEGHIFDEPAERERTSAFTIPGNTTAGTIADPSFGYEDLEKGG